MRASICRKVLFAGWLASCLVGWAQGAERARENAGIDRPGHHVQHGACATCAWKLRLLLAARGRRRCRPDLVERIWYRCRGDRGAVSNYVPGVDFSKISYMGGPRYTYTLWKRGANTPPASPADLWRWTIRSGSCFQWCFSIRRRYQYNGAIRLRWKQVAASISFSPEVSVCACWKSTT